MYKVINNQNKKQNKKSKSARLRSLILEVNCFTAGILFNLCSSKAGEYNIAAITKKTPFIIKGSATNAIKPPIIANIKPNTHKANEIILHTLLDYLVAQ